MKKTKLNSVTIEKLKKLAELEKGKRIGGITSVKNLGSVSDYRVL